MKHIARLLWLCFLTFWALAACAPGTTTPAPPANASVNEADAAAPADARPKFLNSFASW